mmetsp:Transcript_11264/g.26943  ORF Transcript_11264/g.26943 Transcript_11264/m.26943 type:complete len:207 (-) Transcript_11264:1298-1918(-)
MLSDALWYRSGKSLSASIPVAGVTPRQRYVPAGASRTLRKNGTLICGLFMFLYSINRLASCLIATGCRISCGISSSTTAYRKSFPGPGWIRPCFCRSRFAWSTIILRLRIANVIPSDTRSNVVRPLLVPTSASAQAQKLSRLACSRRMSKSVDSSSPSTVFFSCRATKQWNMSEAEISCSSEFIEVPFLCSPLSGFLNWSPYKTDT